MSFWKSLFGRARWNSMPSAVSADLRQRLGQSRFDAFTRICQRHGVFPQMSKVVGRTGCDSDLDARTLAGFLTSVGNELGRQGAMRQDISFWNDAVQVYQAALELKPDHYPAHMGLATTYLLMGRNHEAQAEASRVVQDLDNDIAGGKFANLPGELAVAEEHMKEARSTFQAIADGSAMEEITRRSRVIPKKQEDAIEGLDEILKCLFAILIDRYCTMFPTDPEKTNLDRAAVVLNELVLEDLRGDHVQFRSANAEFVDREKKEVILFENVRRGVLDFLAAKGGLYHSWGHPAADIKADIWISEARRVEPDITIPSTVEEAQDVIDQCLLWYQQHV